MSLYIPDERQYSEPTQHNDSTPHCEVHTYASRHAGKTHMTINVNLASKAAAHHVDDTRYLNRINGELNKRNHLH